MKHAQAVRGNVVHPCNPHNLTPALRALLVAPEPLRFPAIPGVQVPQRMHRIAVLDDWVAPQFKPDSAYGALVPQVDTDGNEVAGIRLPPLAVPVATYTGWNLYAAPYPEVRVAGPRGVSHT